MNGASFEYNWSWE